MAKRGWSYTQTQQLTSLFRTYQLESLLNTLRNLCNEEADKYEHLDDNFMSKPEPSELDQRMADNYRSIADKIEETFELAEFLDEKE